ncbi:Cullin, partial [Gorgonomyces haynaldii]
LRGVDLYNRLREYLREHLTKKVSQAQVMDEALLIYYNQLWKEFTTSASTLNHVFDYLNRHWVKRELDEGARGVYDIYTLCLVSWRDHLFIPIHDKVINAALKLVSKQRNGEAIDTNLIKKAVESFVSLGLDESDSKRQTLDLYKTYFEAPFIAATESFYKSASESFISANTIPDYLIKSTTWLEEEEARLSSYLHPSTSHALISTTEQVLITNHAPRIQGEFMGLLENDRLQDLTRMYNLLRRVPHTLDTLRNNFEQYIKKQGLNSIDTAAEQQSGETDPKVYTSAILSVHKKFSDLAKQAFSAEPGFVASLDRACREFVNRNSICKGNSSKSPELLAKYADSILKKSSKVSEDGEIEELLNAVMTIFKYIEDKDVFQKFYSKHLARRLVNRNSVSDDAEASMIAKLKEACGFEYTNKLQTMFTDISLSKDLNEAFKDQMEKTHDKSELLDFEILVLQNASWPLQAPTSGFNIPDDLLKTYERFQGYYQSQHSGKVLNWLFQISKGELKTNYVKANKVSYTFQVSTYQMAILLLYNRSTVYTFDALVESTGMSPDVLQGQLGILVKAKVVLVQDGDLGQPQSKYPLNMDFKSKKIRINLNVGVKSEAKQESEETHKTIEEDRKLLIQAAIVRIMKTRKALKHVILVQEVISQLSARFKPQIQDIKKCIDILLEKEYIERMEDQKDMYSYVA